MMLKYFLRGRYLRKGFKMDFMMNKHAMNNSREIILEK
jgi:hypothetical protein